jgi:hypothetical protein
MGCINNTPQYIETTRETSDHGNTEHCSALRHHISRHQKSFGENVFHAKIAMAQRLINNALCALCNLCVRQQVPFAYFVVQKNPSR